MFSTKQQTTLAKITADRFPRTVSVIAMAEDDGAIMLNDYETIILVDGTIILKSDIEEE